jgi:hypothetical protein
MAGKLQARTAMMMMKHTTATTHAAESREMVIEHRLKVCATRDSQHHHPETISSTTTAQLISCG